MPTFTVFTPTYNRADTLHRVWESLRTQTFRDFEWVVVDDGSSDHTAELLARWAQEAPFAVRSLYQTNQGKHIAVNRGVSEARGSFFLIADSDDAFDPDALEVFSSTWDQIPKELNETYAGVTARCRLQNGVFVGTPLPRPVFDSDNLELQYRYGVVGEKWGFTRTALLRQYPCIETPDMGSFPWGRIAQAGYKTRYIERVLRTYFVNERKDTMSKGATVRRPLTNVYRNQEVLNFAWKFRFYRPWEVLKALVNLARFSKAAKLPLREARSELSQKGARWALTLLWPVARLLSVRVSQ